MLEDADQDSTFDSGGSLDPDTGAFVDAYVRIIRERGGNTRIGKDFESILISSGVFDKVNARKVSIPISEQSEGT